MSDTAPELDLSAGQYVRGIELNDHTFIAVTSFQQLKVITRDPALLQIGAKRPGSDADDLEHEATIHELIQRALTGSKSRNVGPYKDYIARIVQGETGVLPPMHLWSPDSLVIAKHGASTYSLVPSGEHLLAIDGETQLTAHYRLDSDAGLSPEIRKAHREFRLGAIVHHGVEVVAARQYFHDLNVLAVRPNTSLGLSMDTNDPLMRVVGDVEALPVLIGRVDKQARQLSRRSPKLVTLQSLRQLVVNVAKGISGVQYGAKPAPVDDVDLDALSQVSRALVEDFFELFLPEIADRDGSLAGSGPVLAAVGAMGHVLLRSPAEDRDRLRKELMASLADVDWSKGAHWVGIAGNFTPKGLFSAKGTKEVAYAVFNVLADPQNPGYARVRPARSGAEAAAPEVPAAPAVTAGPAGGTPQPSWTAPPAAGQDGPPA
jgi:DNA sulfur modification protein DndB